MDNSSSPISNKAYILAADVGQLVNVQYDTTHSGAYTENLVDAFDEYGVYSEYHSYNADTVVNSLLNSIPIVMSARRYDSAGEEHGHAFLVDGYEMYRDSIVETYILTYPNGSHIPVLEPEPFQVVYYYSSPYIRYFKMNWGWGDYWNYGSYALYGAWEVNGKSYDHDFYMVHNFKAIE